VIPNVIAGAEVPTGGTIGGNVCCSVRASDTSALLMYDSPSTRRNDPRTFWRLH
jgi:CO/xanthine dehydrogenase FAD-binding subunit